MNMGPGLISSAKFFLVNLRSIATPSARRQLPCAHQPDSRGHVVCQSGQIPHDSDFDPNDRQHKMIARDAQGQTPHGEVHRLAPQVKLCKTPSRWRTPVAVVRGGDLLAWQG